MEMHELPISLWVNNCTQKKNGILYRVEEKFEIEKNLECKYKKGKHTIWRNKKKSIF